MTFTLGVTTALYLDARASTSGNNPSCATPYEDAYDSIVSYEWDLDGDAQFGSLCDNSVWGIDATGPVVTLMQSDIDSLGIVPPADHEIWLRVTDRDGVHRCASTTLHVTDGAPPSTALILPNGGESWDYSPATTDRRHHLIVWNASDNFPPLSRVRLSYSTDGGTTWTCIADSAGTTCAAGVLTPTATSFDWSLPTQAEATAAGQTFPRLSGRIRVEVWDSSGNAASDLSRRRLLHHPAHGWGGDRASW